MSVLATKVDYDRLAENLAAIGRTVVVGFEATGNDHRASAADRRLRAAADLVGRLGSNKRSLHNGWEKNDPKDVQVILHMLRIADKPRSQAPRKVYSNALHSLANSAFCRGPDRDPGKIAISNDKSACCIKSGWGPTSAYPQRGFKNPVGCCPRSCRRMAMGYDDTSSASRRFREK